MVDTATGVFVLFDGAATFAAIVVTVVCDEVVVTEVSCVADVAVLRVQDAVAATETTVCDEAVAIDTLGEAAVTVPADAFGVVVVTEALGLLDAAVEAGTLVAFDPLGAADPLSILCAFMAAGDLAAVSDADVPTDDFVAFDPLGGADPLSEFDTLDAAGDSVVVSDATVTTEGLLLPDPLDAADPFSVFGTFVAVGDPVVVTETDMSTEDFGVFAPFDAADPLSVPEALEDFIVTSDDDVVTGALLVPDPLDAAETLSVPDTFVAGRTVLVSGVLAGAGVETEGLVTLNPSGVAEPLFLTDFFEVLGVSSAASVLVTSFVHCTSLCACTEVWTLVTGAHTEVELETGSTVVAATS